MGKRKIEILLVTLILTTQQLLSKGPAFIARAWQAALGLVLLLWVSSWALGRAGDAHEEELESFRRAAQESIRYADSLVVVVDTRQRTIDTLQGEVIRLKTTRPQPPRKDPERARADSLYAELADSVKGAYEVIPLQQRVIVRQDSTIKVLETTVAVLDSVVVAQETVIDLQTTSIRDLRLANDSMRVVLSRPPKPERFLGIFPLPSRKVVAAVSFVAGGASVIWVGSKL
jgi:hypothetical protein